MAYTLKLVLFTSLRNAIVTRINFGLGFGLGQFRLPEGKSCRVDLGEQNSSSQADKINELTLLGCFNSFWGSGPASPRLTSKASWLAR